MEFVRSYDSIRFGLPTNRGGSAPALSVSGPAQRSLTLRPACSPSRLATLCTRGFSSLVASTAALIATGWSEPVPGRDFHPLRISAFSRRTEISGLAHSQAPADYGNTTPTFRINVVSRTTRAVNYRHRSGATKINFQGTDLMPCPLAREKLPKISGIVLAYPSLNLAVEGNTDSVGTEAFNQRLSEQRAEGVRSYLTQQGIPESSTTAAGFGKTRPMASNDTSEGRQQNRRVELVVSGEVIGTKIISLSLQPVAAVTSPQ
jgi:outer membrane protein OmpA-like peptidoglycan-associated protein